MTRLSLGQIVLTMFSTSKVLALGIIIMVAGNAASIADEKLSRDSPASLNQAATLDRYTSQLER